MAYSGLDTLFQNEGPASGAITGGQREGLAQVADLQSLAKNQLDYERAQSMNPLDVAYRKGQVDAQVPELEKAQVAAKKARETSTSDIEATNAANYSKVTKEQFERVSNMGRMAGELGMVLSQTPPGLQRQQTALQYMQANGIDPQSKVGQYVLTNQPEDLIRVSDTISKHRDAYIQAMGTSEQAGRNQLANIEATGKENRKLRQMEIDAGRYLKTGKANDILSQVQAGKLSFERAATAFQVMADFETDPEKKNSYLQQAARFEQANLAAKRAQAEGKPDVGAMGVPTQTVPGALGAPPAPKPAPALPPGWTVK